MSKYRNKKVKIDMFVFETVCKMLDTQSDIVRKMLKDDMEGKSKDIDEL